MPSEVKVYDTDQTSVLKQSNTAYNLSSNFVSRRIIGLPASVEVQGYNQLTSSMELVSKVSYAYDEGNFSDSGLQQDISPVQHDSTNFGSGFAYRGNLTSTTRWDANAPTTSSITTATLKYNTAGSVVAKITPWDSTNTRTVKIGYADNFNSTPGMTTYAYPTSITDPANNSSTVKYRYDIGANVEATSPAPAGQTYGKTSKRIFDSVGRLERNSVYVSTTEHSYVRYEYPTNGIQSKTYAPIVDQDGDGNIAEDEVYSESWHDGAGRVRMSRKEHPGSTGGWASTFVEYDILGRVKRQSVPTETNSSYTPTGDDSAGALWTHQKYDWMGRVIRKINTDGIDQTTLNDSDVLISYEGCGCAGGLVTTVEGELVPRTDTTGNARRKQKSSADILGRTFKTETFEWDGTTVYSTVLQTFDGADRPVRTRQFAGDTSSSTYQDTTASFDGHGRLASSHRPEQRDMSNNLKYTSYSYNPDDSILSMTDGRGAVTNCDYNSRGLLTEKSWSAPGESGITDPTDVTFSYDNVGNRTQMTDGLGTQTYTYDSLSRLTVERRNFNETLSSAPETSNGYELGYTYHLGGQLKSLTDPFGITVNYGLDKLGRLTGVVPSTAYGSTSTFASDFQYTAFGGLKHVEYGNTVETDQTFNNRLLPASFQVATSTVDVMEKAYQYYADGRLSHLDDSMNYRFDRLNFYDHQGRIAEAKSSNEANGGTVSNSATELPYRQTYAFDEFGNMTTRNNRHWGSDTNNNVSYTFSQNRITNTLWQYDNDGRNTRSFEIGVGTTDLKFDGAGRLELKHDYTGLEVKEDKLFRYYNGDDRELKRNTQDCRMVEAEPPPEVCEWVTDDTTYYIRSSVLDGEIISELGGEGWGSRNRSFVLAGGVRIAELISRYQWVAPPGSGYMYNTVRYYHSDASGLSVRMTRTAPEPLQAVSTSVSPFYVDPENGELDAGFSNVALAGNPWYPGPGEDGDPPPIPMEQEASMMINGQRVTATVDGVAMSYQVLRSLAAAGGLAVDIGGGHHLPVDLTNGNLQMPREYVEDFDENADGFVPRPISWWVLDFQSPNVDRPFDKQAIGAAISKIVSSDRCRNFLKDLLGMVANKKNPAEFEGDISRLFEELVSGRQKGLTRVSPNGAVYGTIVGYVKDKSLLLFSAAGDSLTARQQLMVDIGTVLHELIHGIGRNRRFTDRQMAEALFKSPKYTNHPTPLRKSMENPSEAMKNDNGDYGWSGYWGQILSDHCINKPVNVNGQNVYVDGWSDILGEQ